MRLHAFNGAVNRAHEVLILVDFAESHEEGVMYVPIKKSVAKEITDRARELELEEIDAWEEDGNLYIGKQDEDEASPSDDDDASGEEEEEDLTGEADEEEEEADEEEEEGAEA